MQSGINKGKNILLGCDNDSETKLGKFHLIMAPTVDFDGERGLRNSEPSIFFGVTKSRPLNISPIPRLRGIVLAPMIKLLPNHVNQRVVLHLDIIGSWDIA